MTPDLMYMGLMMIVDANLATYWFVKSPFSTPASRYLNEPVLSAPGLIRIEVASALIKYYRAGFLNRNQVHGGLENLDSVITEFVDEADILASAVEISMELNHPTYDCLYLALAMQRMQKFATADKRLATLASKLSIETELIRPIP